MTFTDDSGKRHQLTTNPGDIVLFETARVPMARLTALPGREVALVAVHVTPEGWPQRFQASEANGRQQQAKPLVAGLRPATEPLQAAVQDQAHKETAQPSDLAANVELAPAAKKASNEWKDFDDEEDSLANVATVEIVKPSEAETRAEPTEASKTTFDEWEDFLDEDGSATMAETEKASTVDDWEDFRDEL